MGFRAEVLRPIAKLAAWRASGQLRAFLGAHQRTRETQDEFLAELLAAHAETDFGKDHGLGKVRSYEDYKTAVPIGTYETHRPYIQRVLEGKPTALLPEDQGVLMFSMSSGTTGAAKHIPVTPRFLADIRRGWNIFGLNVLNQHLRAWVRPIVQISSSAHEQTSPTGLPCGAISGLLAATQKPIVRLMYVVPQWATKITDPTTRYYTILRFGIEKDVAFITTANPSSIIKLIETGQLHADNLIRDLHDGTFTPPTDSLPAAARHTKFRPNRLLARRVEQGITTDGMLLPKHFWNLAFLTHWTGGTLKLYLRRLRKLFGDVPTHDIGLLASEGRFSIPLEPGTAEGVAEITSNFLEFIPAQDRESSNPPTLRAEQLDIGGEYFIVLSNWAGLFRYNIDDRIRVTGFLGQSPVFEFLSRGLHTTSIAGEKITEHQVVEAFAQARRESGANVERFILQGHFTSTPYYELRMERPGDVEPQALAEYMDRALCEHNMEYASKRKSERLGPIRAVTLSDGTLERAEQEHIRRRRGRSEQYKHQYLLTDIIDDDSQDA